MLAVIDNFAGLWVRKCRRAPPQPLALFDNEDAGATLRKPDGGAQAGNAGTDDDDVRPRHAGVCRARCARRSSFDAAATRARDATARRIPPVRSAAAAR